MSHTPGPWKVVYIDGELIGSIYSKKTRICSGICDDMKLEKEAKANAYLIASAPDMKDEINQLKAEKAELLEALEELASVIDESEGVAGYHMNGTVAQWDGFDCVQKIMSVIKKARGEE